MNKADDGPAADGTALVHASDGELAKMMASEHGDDDAAWQEFWTRHSDRLMRYIGWKGRWLTRADCEDVMMDTLGRMQRHIADFVPSTGTKRSLFAWAKTIAKHLILDRVRGEKQDVLTDYIPLQEAAKELEISVPDEESGDDETVDPLERAISMLCDRDQSVLGLRRAGYGNRQIAESLHIRPDLVRKVHYKALQRLETILLRLHSEQSSAPT